MESVSEEGSSLGPRASCTFTVTVEPGPGACPPNLACPPPPPQHVGMAALPALPAPPPALLACECLPAPPSHPSRCRLGLGMLGLVTRPRKPRSSKPAAPET